MISSPQQTQREQLERTHAPSAGLESPYGHFNPNGTEYVITNPECPRAFDNFLWNDSVFSITQHTGVGCLDYQIGDSEAIQLLTGIGRTCDFDVFGRDHLMSRLVYIRDNETGRFWNLNWEPCCVPYETYTCRQGLGYTILCNTTQQIQSGFRIFVPPGQDPVELWDLEFKNKGRSPRSLSIFLYVQFQFAFKWGFNSYGDAIYRETHLNKQLNAVVASKHPFCKPHDYLTAFLAIDQPVVAYDGSREAFVGTYRSLQNPVAVESGHCSNTPGSADATVAAIQIDINLAGGEEKRLSAMLGVADCENNLIVLRDRYLSQTEHYFSELESRNERLISTNSVQTPDPIFNQMINIWIKQGALFGSQWCRWGWNGYRDIVQHGLGVSALMPAKTRQILIDALSHQFSNGLALRGWNPVDEKPYSDSALWLVFTLCAYIKETGDTELLEETVPYYDKEGEDTVLNHVHTALNFLENNKGQHDLILIKFGDWNDSLTGVGKEGRGESVWLSIAYVEAVREMKDLMQFTANAPAADDYEKRGRQMAAAINRHCWDGDWYLRCFDDNGNPLGSSQNDRASIFMEPQCWALISRIADTERSSKLIAACDELLLTDLGYRLLTPPYDKVDPSIGRISSMEPGIAENGTVYTHLNIWMVLGLLRQGQANKAYEIFQRFTPAYKNSPLKSKASFLYANCYYGPTHKSRPYQQEFTWITGSYAWLNTVLINEMIGLKPSYAGLTIDPCLPSHWKEIKAQRYWRGATYHICIKNPHSRERGAIELCVDNVQVPGNTLPYSKEQKDYVVVATIR
jgi:cellobiose phosphorylase